MSTPSRKRNLDEPLENVDESDLTKKERRLISRRKAAEWNKKRESLPGPIDRTSPASSSNSPTKSEEEVPTRSPKKARKNPVGEDPDAIVPFAIPDGMSKKEFVTLRKLEVKQKYESGTLFGTAIATDFTVAKARPTTSVAHVHKKETHASAASVARPRPVPTSRPVTSVPVHKKETHAFGASVAQSRPVPASRPVTAVPSIPSRSNSLPRHPSGPFNSPVPTMQFSATNRRSGPHIPTFIETSDSPPPSQYLSPRTALARASISNDDGNFYDSETDTHNESSNVEPVQMDEAIVTPSSPVSHPKRNARSFTWSAGCILVVGFFSIFIALLVIPEGSVGDFKFVVPTISASSLRCFKDSPKPDGEMQISSKIGSRCKTVPLSSWDACPDGAECAHGLLQKCDNSKYFEVRPEHDSCTVNEQTQKMISDLVSWLEVSSVVHACYLGGNPHALEGDGINYPFFGLSQVFGELDIEWDPVLIQILMDVEGVVEVEQQPDGNFLIALHPNHSIVLPFKCRVKKLLIWIMGGFFGAFFGMIRMVFVSVLQSMSIYWELLYEVPKETLACSIVIPFSGWFAVTYYKKRQDAANELKQLNCDRVLVRQEAYKILRNEPNKNHVVLQVRDQILYDPNLGYHSDSNARNRIIKKVWSKVVADLQKDNRILKARINTNKGACDSWKWGGGD